jgi:hypothetical protein
MQCMKNIILLLFVLGLFACNNNTPDSAQTDGLNRRPQQIHYSAHARCRMECRHINESEIKSVLETGTINYGKSNLNEDDCHKRYAVEAYVQNEHLRVIFVPCNNVVTVVTCIDLDNEWSCNCPGDEQHRRYR